MTKLRLVLLATTALTVMQFASSASHAQSAPIVVAQQQQLGVRTVGDMRALDLQVLEDHFGRYGHRLYHPVFEAITRNELVMGLHWGGSNDNAAPTQIASSGIASFYTEGQQTASGEKFDTHDLTAAHPTLPFGTRLLVTNVATGKSVTVRVNDRGPFIPGRVVDVSYAAAETLGMVDGGIAKVKLDVVQ